jgi:YVTN family beta-propeller protein
VAVGARPAAIAFGAGGVWVSNLDDQSVSHIDPATDETVRAIPMGEPVQGLAAGGRAVWAISVVPNQTFAQLRQINPHFDTVAKTTQVQAGALLAAGGLGNDAAVAVGGGNVWAGTDSGLLDRLDRSGSSKTSLDTGNSPVAIAVGADGVWVADPYANNVARIDPATDLVSSPIPVGNGPSAIAVGANAVWVADSLDDSVVRIDPNTNAVTNTIDVGRSPTGIAVGDGAVWVANSGDGTVSRINLRTYRMQTIQVGGSPQAIAVGGGRVWVTVQPSLAVPTKSARSGGVLRVDSNLPFDFLDTALSYFAESWEVEYATCAKLLNYPDRPAPAGARLVPEVAAALPKPTNGGRTYTFTIRKGFRFSPPSNEAVTAQTFKYTIERTLNPRLKSPAISYASDIVGVQAYDAGKARHISGITAKHDKLTFRLTEPAPDFLTRIAMPFFCAVPSGTPVSPQGVRLIPMAGPYYVVSYSPRQGAVLRRNPNYHGPRPHHLQEIDVSLDIGQKQTVGAIEAGRADFAAAGVPPRSARTLVKRYGPGSAAARAGDQRFFVNPQLATAYLAMNTSRPLFKSARLRRAVNYALDRRTLARIAGFGANVATPTEQLLPPGMPGFRAVHVYPFTPDLARARQLARGLGGHGFLYACSDVPCQQAAQVVQSDLKAIGVDLEIKTFSIQQMFARIGTIGEPFDAAITSWFADYPDPSDFFNLVYGPTIGPNTNNPSRFDDPTWNRRIAAAARLTGPKRYLAYAALDSALTRQDPPYAAIWNGSEQDFFSARIGCETYQPNYGIDLAALCIRR